MFSDIFRVIAVDIYAALPFIVPVLIALFILNAVRETLRKNRKARWMRRRAAEIENRKWTMLEKI